MSPTIFAILFPLIGAILWLNYLRQRRQKLPPGPGYLPIIGNLHQLGANPHKKLYELSQIYGPIMSIRLGSFPAIVVSNPAAAELFLKTHDANFASRPKTQSAELITYGRKGMSLTEYGAYWRNWRKFCTLELLTVAKTDSFAGLRREELDLFVGRLKKSAAAGEVVDVSLTVEGWLEDVIFRIMFGKSRDDRFDLNDIMHELAELYGAFNIADFIPFLKPLDLQGFTKRFKATSKAFDIILETIIDDHVEEAISGKKTHERDFVDALLSLQTNPAKTHEQLSKAIDRSSIKSILIDLIFGAIDTSHTSTLWILSELMRDPETMKRVQDEIKSVVGDGEVVEESHLSKLEYLDMVFKESMRLHTTGPLLIPHASVEDIVINGYFIPKDSRIIINNWAIGRDREAWSENANEFHPERFVGKDIDLKGKNFQLLPFSSGRRGCPGSYMGSIMVKLVVAQLVHTFNWELPDNRSPKELDMEEKFALTLSRANHLKAIPSLRSP